MHLTITVEQLRALGMPEDGIFLCARWAKEQEQPITIKETPDMEYDPNAVPNPNDYIPKPLAPSRRERLSGEAQARLVQTNGGNAVKTVSTMTLEQRVSQLENVVKILERALEERTEHLSQGMNGMYERMAAVEHEVGR